MYCLLLDIYKSLSSEVRAWTRKLKLHLKFDSKFYGDAHGLGFYDMRKALLS